VRCLRVPRGNGVHGGAVELLDQLDDTGLIKKVALVLQLGDVAAQSRTPKDLGTE
jgi:hypothetical protein